MVASPRQARVPRKDPDRTLPVSGPPSRQQAPRAPCPPRPLPCVRPLRDAAEPKPQAQDSTPRGPARSVFPARRRSCAPPPAGSRAPPPPRTCPPWRARRSHRGMPYARTTSHQTRGPRRPRAPGAGGGNVDALNSRVESGVLRAVLPSSRQPPQPCFSALEFSCTSPPSVHTTKLADRSQLIELSASRVRRCASPSFVNDPHHYPFTRVRTREHCKAWPSKQECTRSAAPTSSTSPTSNPVPTRKSPGSASAIARPTGSSSAAPSLCVRPSRALEPELPR